MRQGTRDTLPENMMDVAPPDGFLLMKQKSKIMVGDRIMTSNRAGEWLEVQENHGLAGIKCNRLADQIGAQIKLCRRIK